MSSEQYDVIVLGLGGMGSSTVFHLAKHGLRVLGIDQHDIAHSLGSSHGETRVIRKAYFEHPAYVGLLRQAYKNWRELESESNCSLLVEQGLIEVGPPDGVLVQGVRRACDEHGLSVEQISHSEFLGRFPGFTLPDGMVALYEPEGGFLFVEQCIASYCRAAAELGAQLLNNTEVTSWKASQSEVSITTGTGKYRAAKLIICAGAWSTRLLQDLQIPMRVLRKHLHWIEVPKHCYRQRSGSPCFFYETSGGCYYGFPQLAQSAQAVIKIAEHTGGETISDPSNVDRSPDLHERERVNRFVREYLPEATSKMPRHAVCMYTMTPDEHFVIDQHPEFDSVSFAAGFSGHGFKFASVVGEILAEMATKQETTLPIDFLKLRSWDPFV